MARAGSPGCGTKRGGLAGRLLQRQVVGVGSGLLRSRAALDAGLENRDKGCVSGVGDLFCLGWFSNRWFRGVLIRG